MKKTITTLLLCSEYQVWLCSRNSKQVKQKLDPETNCYLKWAQKFENRGADDVDGVYRACYDYS